MPIRSIKRRRLAPVLAAATAAALLSACQHTPPSASMLAGPAGVPASCTPTDFAAPGALREQSKLPDPFHFADGRAVASRADWACRRAELSAQIQHYELGEKPGPDPVEARMEGQDL